MATQGDQRADAGEIGAILQRLYGKLWLGLWGTVGLALAVLGIGAALALQEPTGGGRSTLARPHSLIDAGLTTPCSTPNRA